MVDFQNSNYRITKITCGSSQLCGIVKIEQSICALKSQKMSVLNKKGKGKGARLSAFGPRKKRNEEIRGGVGVRVREGK